jgi:hypothetical protein
MNQALAVRCFSLGCHANWLKFLALEFPVHDLHCLSGVLAARFLSPGEIEDRAHALTGRANATIAQLMYCNEVLGLPLEDSAKKWNKRSLSGSSCFTSGFGSTRRMFIATEL